MAICLSIGGTTTYSEQSPVEEVLIGTVSGVWTIKRDKSRQWAVAGHSLPGCHIHALVAEPTSGLFFAGVHKGTVYASGDHGQNWELRDQGLTQKNVYCLNYTNVDGKVKLYAGTEPAHLFESDDLGMTWNELGSLRSVPSMPNWTFPAPPNQAHVKNVAFDPTDPSTIYACVEQGGLFRSKDAGSTWEEIHGFDTDLPFEMPEGSAPDDLHRILVRPSNPKRFYICGGFGLCHTADGGARWEHLTTPAMRIGYPDALLINPRNEDLMFMAGAVNNPRFWRDTHDANATIARSRDSGKTWSLLQNGLPLHMRAHVPAMALVVNGKTLELFAGTTDGEIFFSNNEGDDWTKIVNTSPLSKAGHYIMLGAANKVSQ